MQRNRKQIGKSFFDHSKLLLTYISYNDISVIVIVINNAPKMSNLPETVPLTHAAFHILLALADGERHGYAIMQEVTRSTEGGVRMGPGTLYGTIKRLLANGWIEESDERPDPHLDDERRRYYRLTDVGARVAAVEVRRMSDLVKAARVKRLLTGLKGAV
jgi:DNA-binding PadR family transcriptional regulator